MVSENELVVRRFFIEIWNTGDLAVADELVASEHQHHLGDEILRGPEGVKGAVTWLRAGFPDLTFTMDDVVSDGDRVVVRWTATGTHGGTIFDVPPTGRRVRWTGIDLVRLDDGKLVELWAEADGSGLMDQLTREE